MANGGKYTSPILAAMKLPAHTTTKTAIEAAIAGRLGARPVEDSIFTASDQAFFANRDLLDEVEPWLESDAGPRRNTNRALRRHGDYWRDNIFCPVALAGRHVAGKRKIGQRRKRNVVRAANPRLKHAAAPHRNTVLLADVVNPARHAVAAHPAHFDIDDLARPQLHGRLRLLFAVHAFIQANRSLKPFLKLDVAVEIVPAKRLLDHHQVKAIELLQQRKVRKRVSGVLVNHQFDSWKFLPQPPHLL